MRRRRPKWRLLYRREGTHKVYIYEPLRKCDLKARKRQGWKVIESR